MMVFQHNGRRYGRSSAVEIVRALEEDERDYRHRGGPLRQFLAWSLERLTDRIPPREMQLSDRMDDEAVALHYLYLRDEYGAGEFTEKRRASRRF
jgi:hypothetical protein